MIYSSFCISKGIFFINKRSNREIFQLGDLFPKWLQWPCLGQANTWNQYLR